MSAYVYILASHKNGTLYIGVTNNLHRRICEHERASDTTFVGKYDVLRLVHFEMFDSIKEAIRREKQLKNWRRAWKIALIESQNPEWSDYSGVVKDSLMPALPRNRV